MTDSNSPQVNQLLDRLQNVVRFEPDNVRALCQIGGELAQLGREQDVQRCYRAAVDALRRTIREGDVQAALIGEVLIYQNLVKLEESEEHYARCFADWRDDLSRLGMRFRQDLDVSRYDAHRVAFFLHAGHLLGHAEVLFKMLEGLKELPYTVLHPRIYVLTDHSREFLERASKLGVETILIENMLPGGRAAPLLDRFLWLRESLLEARLGVCIWVSLPPWSAFALPMRLAPVQIFWALRFHPVGGPDIDGHITWGASNEETRRYGGQKWQVVPMPLAIDESPPPRAEVENLRRHFPESVLLGTLAREEKINSEPFLRAVADILVAHPHAGFVWTGRVEHSGIAAFFRAAGVEKRCHYVGWVNTKIYAAALDVFLETFPVGSGITSYQAFAAGVPLLSYLHPQSIFGTHYWHSVAAPDARGDASTQPRLNAPDEYPILCARDPAEYVALAGRLICDPAWRTEIGARGRAFYRDELQNNKVYAKRFFTTVARIAASKLGVAAQAGGGETGA